MQQDNGHGTHSGPQRPGQGPGRPYRGSIIFLLLLAIAAAAGYLIRLQMATPISVVEGVPQPGPLSAERPLVGDTEVPAAEELGEPPQAEVAIQQPPEQPPAVPDKLTVEAWVEAGKLRVKCNVTQQVEVYPLAKPEGKQELTIVPGHAAEIDLEPAVAAELAGKMARLEISLEGDRPVFVADPPQLKVFVNRRGWPNDRYRPGEKNRIGFNFPAEQEAYGIALTGLELGLTP